MSDPKPRKQKPKPPAPGGAERLKTVVRRLPPNLPEPVFWQSVETWVTDDTVTWKSYFPGKFRTKRTNKEGVPSRAYIAFKHPDLVARFSREYDGHLFRDKAGNESHAVVEFAPFQKTPVDKKKHDARNNTIDRDEDYLAFLERLKGAGEPPEVVVAPAAPPPPPTTTPLLEALKAEKLAQKDKETILRSHAHYIKDVKKEEAKKKAVPPPAPAPTSKKAKKAAAAAAATAPSVEVPPATPSKRVKQGEDGQRRTRPVVGLGRQFEAALHGAVAVSPTPLAPPPPPERKKREDKGKRREDAPAVPSILQRPEEEVVVPPKVTEAAGSGVPTAARAPRKASRRGKGRGG